ncbi:CDC50 family protein-like protein [Lophiostoma macrostomum CBS 122681]|uniref:CDC50 family protein-like protein n=1 Tax=Lophiostoma macrostomum CBS 122681 TaxID=1314788 RepID=A0A6A6TNV1_9PLEO|nr:CDC50 family protein-like protein [Lophiostoma macrostomum CBS 122681]
MSQTQQQVEHTDSIHSQDPHQDPKKKTKSRRPANTAFRQQRLKAWQPILTPKTVLPLFFIVGIIFAPIGGLLLYASSQVKEISIDYTGCSSAPQVDLSATTPEVKNMPSGRVSNTFKGKVTEEPKWGQNTANYTFVYPKQNFEVESPSCLLEFQIPDQIKPPIYMYYRLTNFYQNHRRYVKSFDVDQLKGKAKDTKGGDCDPLEVNHEGKPYYPCGLIANSMFNDTFANLTVANPSQGSGRFYNMTQYGIAWGSEKDLYGVSAYEDDKVVPPPNWAASYPKDGYASTGIPDIHTWEPFQVWMRTAGLPTFSKLAMKNEKDTLEAGTYRIQIYDRFPVEKYGGTKSILISTRTIMGGKNPFLGIAYVVVGGLCILLGAIFTATHLIKPRKLGDHTYLSWNNDQPSTATATGRSPRPGDTA